MSSATSRPWRRAAATKRSKSSIVPSPGSTAVCPPSAAPIAHGLPGSPWPCVERVVRGLCGSCGRSGEWAAGRRRRSPSRRHTEGESAASANVALRFGSVPAERGNISYQREKRARSGSTITPRMRSNLVARDRSGASAIRRRSVSPNASATRSPVELPPRPRSGRKAAPSRSSLSTSCPAPNFFDSSARQLSKRSIHPSTVYSYRPSVSTVKAASQRSFSTGAIRYFAPLRLAAFPVEHHPREHVVAVGDQIGGDRDLVSDHPLDRKPAAVHLRKNVFDNHPTLQRRVELILSLNHAIHQSPIRNSNRPPWDPIRPGGR